ncbi:MAG: hypothetical protein EOP11_26575 [Proteobacteria bacterium]|nr:MAG: hypothetical protein EOP11_26575 [Pseudomonadota bacterium]
MKSLFALLALSTIAIASAHAGNGFTPREREQMERALDRQRCRETGRCFLKRSSRPLPKRAGSGNRFSPSEQGQMENSLGNWGR